MFKKQSSTFVASSDRGNKYIVYGKADTRLNVSRELGSAFDVNLIFVVHILKHNNNTQASTHKMFSLRDK